MIDWVRPKCEDYISLVFWNLGWNNNLLQLGEKDREEARRRKGREEELKGTLGAKVKLVQVLLLIKVRGLVFNCNQ